MGKAPQAPRNVWFCKVHGGANLRWVGHMSQSRRRLQGSHAAAAQRLALSMSLYTDAHLQTLAAIPADRRKMEKTRSDAIAALDYLGGRLKAALQAQIDRIDRALGNVEIHA